MSAYRLGIYTPDRLFFDEHDVESTIVESSDGELCVLANHAPLIAVLPVGCVRIRQGNEWRECFISEGTLDVLPNRVLIFVQAAEWPEQIDDIQAEEARKRALNRLRSATSIQEYTGNRVALTRAMMRLRVSKHEAGLK